MSIAYPVPHPTSLSAPFWEGTRQGELRLQRCDACGAFRFSPQVLCRGCRSDRYQWVATSGRGSVYSYTVVYRAATPAFDAEIPYVIAVVELDEGPLMLTTIEECEPDEVSVGAAVDVSFRELTDEITLYPFRLASRPAGAAENGARAATGRSRSPAGSSSR